MALTCVTLSPTPFARDDVPDGIEYLNHVSIFTDPAEEFSSRVDAIQKVNTEHFFFVDSDDPFPRGVRAPKSRAILHGAEQRIHHPHIDITEYPQKWDAATHLKTPLFMHAAVVLRTDLAQRAIEKMPRGWLHLPWMLTYVMASVGGVERDINFVYTWLTHNSVVHLRRQDPGAMTKQWLDNHSAKLIGELL